MKKLIAVAVVLLSSGCANMLPADSAMAFGLWKGFSGAQCRGNWCCDMYGNCRRTSYYTTQLDNIESELRSIDNTLQYEVLQCYRNKTCY